MRYGTKPAEYVISASGERIGIGLTSDFCAEHEQGLGPIYDKLGLNPNKIGYKSRIIHKGLRYGQMVPKNKEDTKELYFYITTLPEDKVSFYLNNMRAKYSSQEGPHTDGMWDKDDLIFYTNDYIYAKNLFEKLCKNESSVLIGRRMAAFDNGTLFIVLKDSLDDNIKNELEQADTKAKITKKLAKEGKLKELVDSHRETWRKTYGCDDTPWDYFAISPQLQDDGSLKYWLNPGHQQHNNFGWYEKQDFIDWLEGKGPIPISQEHYRHLDLICKIKRNFCMSSYNTKHYNLYPKSRANTIDPAIKNAIATGKLDNKAIKAIESIVKAYCDEFLRYRKDYWGNLEPGLPESFRTLNEYLNDSNRTAVQDRSIHMMLSAYAETGLLDRTGACNTPTVRTNKNWWSDLLDNELKYETIMESGVFTEEEQKFIKSFDEEKQKQKARKSK